MSISIKWKNPALPLDEGLPPKDAIDQEKILTSHMWHFLASSTE